MALLTHLGDAPPLFRRTSQIRDSRLGFISLLIRDNVGWFLVGDDGEQAVEQPLL